MNKLLMATALTITFASAATAEQVVSQKDKQFVPGNLTIKVGDTVTFQNDDPYFHNVFSMSEAKTFDLGNFPAGESRSITFDKPGKVDIECTIHPLMNMTIDVQE